MKLIANVSSVDANSRTVTVVASTPNAVDGEALASWDLSRYRKNPIVLWNHDPDKPLGTGLEIEPTPEGLVAKIKFARLGTSPLVDEKWSLVEQGILRAVSVAFTPGAATHGEDGTTTRAANELLEISFVSVGKDEDAGTSAINPAAETDEERRKRISAAASALASSRRAKLDSNDAERFDFGGRLAKAKRNANGAAYIPARITRTGVLVYHLPNGKTRREYRPADEVFNADSLATLADVPVVDIANHSRLYEPSDWRDASRGHVKAYRRDGKFVGADLVVQDKETLDAIDRGDRTEISCGYVCTLDMTPGVTPDGEPYDCVQRNIRYNHVALCPPNRGRAGPEVGLRLDQQPDARWGVANICEAQMTIKVRLDGTDFDFGSEAHIQKLDSMHKSEIDSLTKSHDEKVSTLSAERSELQSKLDATQAKLDAAAESEARTKRAAEKEKEEFAKREKEIEEKAAARAKARSKLIRSALRFMMEDEEAEEKLDAKSDREIMLEVIRKDSPNFDDTDKSDDYVSARYDSVCEKAKVDRGIHGATRQIVNVQSRTDSLDTEDPVSTARRKRDEAAANAWRAGR